jgi:hypothetical protein
VDIAGEIRHIRSHQDGHVERLAVLWIHPSASIPSNSIPSNSIPSD